jgi:hypothetical protein
MSQDLTNLIPAAIFIAIFLFIYGLWTVRVRRAQNRITAYQEELVAQSERQSAALERIAASLESFKDVSRG